MAGGLDSEAGNRIRITRKLEYGRIPLPTAGDDLTGQYSIAEVSAKAIMEAQNPQENIVIQPYDVISVPRAEMVYVIGEVKKAGGFVLRDRETVSVLQALSLAEGLVRTAAPQRAKILRPSPGGTQRTEILVDLRSLLAGKGMDTVLKPDDILFIPNDAAKSAILRAAETALGMGTGIATGLVIYRR